MGTYTPLLLTPQPFDNLLNKLKAGEQIPAALEWRAAYGSFSFSKSSLSWPSYTTAYTGVTTTLLLNGRFDITNPALDLLTVTTASCIGVLLGTSSNPLVYFNFNDVIDLDAGVHFTSPTAEDVDGTPLGIKFDYDVARNNQAIAEA